LIDCAAIECMGTACYVLADEDFILSLLTNSSLRDKYQKYTFSDHVKVSAYISIIFFLKFYCGMGIVGHSFGVCGPVVLVFCISWW